MIGSILKNIKTNQLYEIVTQQGYMNYDVGIEQIDRENADTEYIKISDIGKLYELVDENTASDNKYGMRVHPNKEKFTRHSSYNPEDIKPIAPTPKIKEVVIYADEVAVIYYTNGTCEHVGNLSYSDAFLVVDEGDIK